MHLVSYLPRFLEYPGRENQDFQTFLSLNKWVRQLQFKLSLTRFFSRVYPPHPKNLALTQTFARFEKEIYLLKSYHFSNPWDISSDH